MVFFDEEYLDYLLGRIQGDKHMYLIRSMHCKAEDWYFSDMYNEDKPHQIVWVPFITPAFKFVSEEAVEEFRSQFISPRKTEIIRLKAVL